MAYTVLARKYRSLTFDDVVGQDAISQTLKNAIKTHRVAHAFLFTGTRGVGKTTMARVLAKALNCLNSEEPTTTPCCKCDSCLAINLGDDIDVIEIDGASNNRVDEIRELRENAIYRPARARFKIYIIDEVHMLTTGAFNALLKTLEEPPEHVKFIFATTEPNKVLQTIQSRCQRFDFNSLSPNHIAQQLKYILKEEKIKYDEDLILPLAKMAKGSMRDGLSLLDRLISTGAEPLNAQLLEEFLGCPNSETIYLLVEKIGLNDAAAALEATEQLINTGLSEVQIVDALVDSLRDLMVVKSAGEKSELLILTKEQRTRIAQLAENFDIAGLIYAITTLEKLRWSIKNSETARPLLEACILRFTLSEHFLNVDTLLSQTPTKAPIKKNAVVNRPKQTASPEKTKETATPKPQLKDLQAIKDNWPQILETVKTKLGPSTSGLLTSAQPTKFTDGVLTLTFDPSAQMSKKMLENNGRTESLRSLLTEFSPSLTKINLETTEGESANNKTISQKRDEITTDPAVKTVQIGLNAKIIGIKEDQ